MAVFSTIGTIGIADMVVLLLLAVMVALSTIGMFVLVASLFVLLLSLLSLILGLSWLLLLLLLNIKIDSATVFDATTAVSRYV